jgi:hypothetical protein
VNLNLNHYSIIISHHSIKHVKIRATHSNIQKLGTVGQDMKTGQSVVSNTVNARYLKESVTNPFFPAPPENKIH